MGMKTNHMSQIWTIINLQWCFGESMSIVFIHLFFKGGLHKKISLKMHLNVLKTRYVPNNFQEYFSWLSQGSDRSNIVSVNCALLIISDFSSGPCLDPTLYILSGNLP